MDPFSLGLLGDSVMVCSFSFCLPGVGPPHGISRRIRPAGDVHEDSAWRMGRSFAQS